MLEYNTQKEKLALSEYGRNVQQMVDYCPTIENRDERKLVRICHRGDNEQSVCCPGGR